MIKCKPRVLPKVENPDLLVNILLNQENKLTLTSLMPVGVTDGDTDGILT